MCFIRSIQLIIFLLFGMLNWGSTQALQLNFDTCLKRAIEFYPVVKQLGLLERAGEYTVSNLSKAWWPQFGLNAQATYQSDVTHFDVNVPGIPLPVPPDKDQYKTTLDVGQTIYDGGQIAIQKNIARTNAKIEILKTETELHKIKERIIQLYFGNLLIQQQLLSLDLLDSDLKIQTSKAKVNLDAKIISPSNLYNLQAEEIKLQQRKEELMTMKKQWLLMLSEFIQLKLDASTEFQLPELPLIKSGIHRIELSLFEQQSLLYDYNNKLLKSGSLPRFQAFAQLGYANPALNFLKNEFTGYYITGLRLNWNISNLYTLKNTNRLKVLNKSITDLQKETFEFNTRLNLIQQQEEMDKYRRLLESDEELIILRCKVKEAAKVQWENGVIPVGDFLRELNAEEQARTNKALHQVQYLQSAFMYNYHSGI